MQEVIDKAMDVAQRTKKWRSDLRRIQVSGVLHCTGIIAIVSILDNRVKNLGKHLIEKVNTISSSIFRIKV